MNNDQIHVRAEFNIEQEKIDEFKNLIQIMNRMVENNTNNIQFFQRTFLYYKIVSKSVHTPTISFSIIQ